MHFNHKWGAIPRWLGILFLTLSAPACSKTVTWEEEVLLNTGETISIRRTMPWEPLGGFGNPLDVAMRPTYDQTIRFKYKGKEYVYRGRANIRWIAISPLGRPVLVARAGDLAWARRSNYYCVVPYYVQFIPDPDGEHWTWPENIETWLHLLPANVMATIPTLEEVQRNRYSMRAKNTRDASHHVQSPTAARIDPNYKEEGCIHKIDADTNKRPEEPKK